MSDELREAAGRFLRRVGGLTVEFRDGKPYLPVHDDWVGDLEAGYRAALAARPDSPTLDVALDRAHDELRDDRTPLPGKPWLVRLTCCGRADGVYAALTWEEADRFRLSYTAPGHYEDVSGLGGGHRRSAVIEDGYAPALAARPDSPTLDVALLWRVIATTEIIGPDGIPPHRWDLYADTTARIIAREYDRLAAEAPERPAPETRKQRERDLMASNHAIGRHRGGRPVQGCPLCEVSA